MGKRIGRIAQLDPSAPWSNGLPVLLLEVNHRERIWIKGVRRIGSVKEKLENVQS
jgi:hypothetical protein